MQSINTMKSRRGFLTTAAVLAGGIALAGCSSAQITEAQTEWATIVGQVQSAVATGAQYIPTVESIAATAASLFGPEYTALVTVGSAALNSLITTLESVLTAATPAVVASARRRLASSSRSVPVAVGVTPEGISVIGWKAGA